MNATRLLPNHSCSSSNITTHLAVPANICGHCRLTRFALSFPPPGRAVSFSWRLQQAGCMPLKNGGCLPAMCHGTGGRKELTKGP
eukprot:jgi/Mesen1/2267/ME000154S01439